MAMRMMPMRWLLAGLFAWCLVSTSTLYASAEPHSRMSQPRCTDHTRFTNHLKNKYGETQVGMGFVSPTDIIEVYVSKRGSFTVLVTKPNGKTCLVAAGRGWEDINPENPDPET